MRSPGPALNFSVDGQLIGELGERLVTRNHVALSELIKNSYDADATSITVSFVELKNSDEELVPSIVVKDDGVGMSFADVKSNWMRIATANKQIDDTSSVYGRPRTGNKGIGRFACQRLSEELVLTTISRSDRGVFTEVSVTFIWSDFVPGSNLTEIPCTYTKRTLKNADVGTRLELKGLRDNWTDRDYDTLRRTVAMLTFAQEVKRPGYSHDPGFSIWLHGPDFESGSGDLFENIRDAGWGRLKGKVSNRGELLLKLSGKYLREEKTFSTNRNYINLAGLEFDISYFLGHESYVFNRDTKTLTKNVLSDLRKEAGVRVYFEGFRVFSIGEAGDDWLRLERDYAARKSSIENSVVREIASSYRLNDRDVALVRPRGENLLGRVFLKKAHEKTLQIKMNREGFVDSQDWRQLIALLRLSIEWMTVHYAYARQQQQSMERKEAEDAFVKSLPAGSHSENEDTKSKPVKRAVDFLAKTAAIQKNSLDAAESTKISAVIEDAKRVIETNLRERDTEVGTLRTLASTAPLLFTFSHEVFALIGRLDTHASLLRNFSKKIANSADTDKLLGIAEDMTSTSQQFRQMSNLFGILADSRGSSLRRHYIKPLIENMIGGTRFVTDNSKIKVAVACPDDLKTPKIKKAEFVSILVNIFTNALKSTIAGNGSKINFICKETGDGVIIEVLDSGVGLSEKYRSEVFSAFVSDPENQIYRRLDASVGGDTISSLGKGTGLGLSIVKGIVEEYEGSIGFFDRKSWAIGVRIFLPRNAHGR